MASEFVGISTYEWHSVIRGYHVYKAWTPVLGKELAVKKEEDNRYAVSIIMNV